MSPPSAAARAVLERLAKERTSASESLSCPLWSSGLSRDECETKPEGCGRDWIPVFEGVTPQAQELHRRQHCLAPGHYRFLSRHAVDSYLVETDPPCHCDGRTGLVCLQIRCGEDWYFDAANDDAGLCTIRNARSGLYLTVDAGEQMARTCCRRAANLHSLWSICRVEHGYLAFRHFATGSFLSISDKYSATARLHHDPREVGAHWRLMNATGLEQKLATVSPVAHGWIRHMGDLKVSILQLQGDALLALRCGDAGHELALRAAGLFRQVFECDTKEVEETLLQHEKASLISQVPYSVQNSFSLAEASLMETTGIEHGDLVFNNPRSMQMLSHRKQVSLVRVVGIGVNARAMKRAAYLGLVLQAYIQKLPPCKGRLVEADKDMMDLVAQARAAWQGHSSEQRSRLR
eukprot:TRINITY_DN110791_c0_g1_i1.p1 TRINITY_DN110791_c0_g1~~TRINITY_DN110791_c0_g1_i1.p1  ORF type:complete len:406 (+),score=66.87 TRINITY_DN110791_c0_g1_i1:72-1289(+)